jgi:hypothetical protein
MDFQEVLELVHDAARAGHSLDRIDDELIVTSELDEDAQAALWIAAAQFIAGRERYAARQALAFRGARDSVVAGGD